MKTITRGELYMEVWRTPISTLAAQWDVPVSAINKACKELNIPQPYNDHWKLLARGKPHRLKPLPLADATTPVRTTIHDVKVSKNLTVESSAADSDVSHVSPPNSTEQEDTLAGLEKIEGPDSIAPEHSPTLAELSTGGSTVLADRANALDAFDKLELAYGLIQKALVERPSLQVLQLDPMLRSLAQGLRILVSKDSELDLQNLMLKHEWFVGQRFYVRAVVRDVSQRVFVVLPAQDIPEGIVIVGHTRMPDLDQGQIVGLNLEIRRRGLKADWGIRAIDVEHLK